MKAKAIPVSIFRNKLYEGCSNGGISERFEDILLVCDDGFVDVDLDDPPENLCKLVVRNIFGSQYKHVEPYKKAQHIGWMSGGAIVYTSDSRFSRMSDYPLSLHDRQERLKNTTH